MQPERTGADASTPSLAGVYDVLRGGTDNSAADKELAAAMTEICPQLAALARVNRDFVLGAVRWSAAHLRIGQFLDLGAGLPLPRYLHDEARDAEPGAVVVYTDKDPVAVSHSLAVRRGEGWGDGTAVIRGDASDPCSVLGDETVRRLLDLTEPVAIVLGGTLSAMDSATARRAVAGFMAALAPGSAAIISCVSYADQARGDAIAAAFGAAGEWVSHPLADVASFFGGLRIIHNRVMDLSCWPACPAVAAAADVAVLGGIGVRE